MRTETYNTLRQNSVNSIAANEARLSIWNSDPVGVGSTLTAEFSMYENETVEFLADAMDGIRRHTELIAKLDELHGV